jgi:hypothetical protein
MARARGRGRGGRAAARYGRHDARKGVRDRPS